MKVVVCVEPQCGRATRGAIAVADSLAAQGWRVVWLTAAAEPSVRTQAGAADEHLHVVDPCLRQIHAQSLATVMATAVLREMPMLILTGVRSDARGRGVMPAALAEALKCALLPYASSVVPAEDGQHADVWLEGASERVAVKATYPAVIACVPSHGPATPRARTHEPPRSTVLTVTDLGIHPRSLRRAELLTQEAVLSEATTVDSAAALWKALERPPAGKP